MHDLALLDGLAKARDVQAQASALVGCAPSYAAKVAAGEMAEQQFDFAPVVSRVFENDVVIVLLDEVETAQQRARAYIWISRPKGSVIVVGSKQVKKALNG